MSLTKFTGATNWIRSLINKPTKPASELKEDFDKAGDLIKTYINETLTEEIDTQLENKANNSDVYSKTEANTLLGEKANSADVYTKAESDNLLNDKANSTDLIKYKLKSDFAFIEGTADVAPSVSTEFAVSYPAGFTRDNCVLISFGLGYNISLNGFNYVGYSKNASYYNKGAWDRRVNLTSGSIVLGIDNPTNSSATVGYKIVLMKIS